MISLHKDRQLVRNAAMRLIGERNRFDQKTRRLRDGFDRYRPAIVLGGGFALGLLLSRQQFAQATRSITSIARLGFGLMSSSLGSTLVAATLRKSRRNNSKLVPAPEQAQS